MTLTRPILLLTALLVCGCSDRASIDGDFTGSQALQRQALRMYQGDAEYRRGYIDGARSTGALPSEGAK